MRCRIISSLVIAMLVFAASRAAAQDTLSDSAWNADRARRAAARAKAQARMDSLARLVDTIVASPASLTVTVGDSVDARKFYDRVRWTGLRANLRDSVHTFSKVLVLQPNPYLVYRNGYFVAVAAGDAEIWAWPGRPGESLRPSTGPRTIVPVTIR
jgi:hypothetical protein